MQTLEVTDDQYAYIQHLREQLSEQVVGKYGTVRERDAVQFLIDNLDDELDLDGEFDPESPSDARAMSYSEGKSDDAASEPSGSDGESPVDSADETDAEEDADAEESADSDEETDSADSDEETDSADSDEETDSADQETTAEGDAGGEASDDDMLDRMMNLLDTHDDKWEESPAADYRYRVDLPDGGTEDVQTKDDVRALLFKHY